MIPLTRKDHPAAKRWPVRWALAFTLVAGVHLAAGATILYWKPYMAPPAAEPAAAIMVELMPLPSSPPTPVSDMAPGPEVVETSPQQAQIAEPVVERPPEDITPPPPTLEETAVLLPPTPEPKEEEEEKEDKKEQEELLATPQTTAPPQSEAPDKDLAAAPVEAAPSLSQSKKVASWQSVLLSRLERFKRYPSEMRRQRVEGVAYVRFSMDRKGLVLRMSLDESSGAAILDQEALALIDRAQPLPPPPADISGELIELVVPIDFFLRR